MLYLDGKPFQELPDQADVERAIWIDLLAPTPEERQLVLQLGPELPPEEMVEEIEASSRFTEVESGVRIHTLFLQRVDRFWKTASVAFLLSRNRLITLRREEISTFRRFLSQRNRHPLREPVDLLLSLFEIAIDDLADTLEILYQDLEKIGHFVLEEQDFYGTLSDLIHCQDTNDKVRLCLLDQQRALSFLMRQGELSEAERKRLREILRDAHSLLPHNSFLFEKIDFLMATAQGFINIEQNRIVKIFSVAAVIFLPPTLVASIYGMNFRYMPELEWPWGYPMALGIMLLSAILPYWYFRHKGWL